VRFFDTTWLAFAMALVADVLVLLPEMLKELL
jgi:hypothetical protein